MPLRSTLLVSLCTVLLAAQTIQTNAPAANPTAIFNTPGAIPPPDAAHQQQMLDRMRQYALQYTAKLPDYICTQVVRRYIDRKSKNRYHLIDTWLIRVSYTGGRENYSVYSINKKRVNLTMDEAAKRGGSVSIGEFASLMRSVFDPKSNARFSWGRWDNLRNRKMAVFTYFIDSAHSGYRIIYERDQRIIAAYRGLIYADQNTGTIFRTTLEAVDIPKDFPVQYATDILDFDTVEINGRPYICPLRADMQMRMGRKKTKNDIEFRNYQKFGTESNIQYDVNAPPPLPEDQTQGQPATGSPGSSPANTTLTEPAKAARQKTAEPASPSGSGPWELPAPAPPQ